MNTVKMKFSYVLAAILLAVSGVQATTIPLTNAGFEDPAKGKITGFDVAGPSNVPGWSDVGSNADSGVESGYQNSGSYAAFFMGGDPGAYQMTGYTIQAGDVFTVGFWASDIASASGLTVKLFGDTVGVPANVLGSYTASGLPAKYSYSYYETTLAAPAGLAGQELGIQFVNAGGGWTALDDISLSVSTNPVSYVPDPVSARSSTAPVATVDLSGTWAFTPNGGATTSIQVPGGGWFKQGFTDVVEADYETSITVPAIGGDQVTRLEFGAINYEADLYIDGTFVANSVQAYTPASFDITGYVTPGSNYNIRVHVKSMGARMYNGKSLDPNGAGSWAFDDPNNPTHTFLAQGIFRSAELKIYPQVYISDVFVKPSVSTSSLYYDVTLRNESSSSTNVTLSGDLDSWNGDSWSYPSLPSQAITLAAETETNFTVGPVTWDLGTNSYWWPNVPYQAGYESQLHNLNLTLAPTGGGADIHTNTTRFGFRECTQGPDGLGNICYFLNGIRVNFRGDNLQGANYDRIDNGGQGDAFDTYPGFLPGASGWPKAVDNYLRLNYNVVRIHQIPASPYMLDICDEMGLMIIDESAIRGAGSQQDFVTGWNNMVNHVKALFTRDRNHAAVVRLSQSNEPDNAGSLDSTAFEEALYAACMEVDGTRPISIDAAGWNSYDAITHANFSVFEHYGLSNGEWGNYTDEVFARSDRPYGCGEFIWFADNTPQGLAWFATATQAMRAKGASDIRPYTLLSAWASVIPGTTTSAMRLEDPPYGWYWTSGYLYPLYGENNLPDPWSNLQIQRLQAGFNPVLVADADYWEAVKLSNSNGDWPGHVPALTPNHSVTRTLNIYNDTFSGTNIDVFWELHVGAPDGALVDSGVINATVPLGYIGADTISFTTPYVANGTSLYLVLRSEKDGVELFREEDQRFVILNADPGAAPGTVALSGSAFGTSPAYANGYEFDMATDGNPSTYFDYANRTGGYTGIDLGAGNEAKVSHITYTPRSGYEARMLGGEFQGSNTGTDAGYTTIYTINAVPSGTTTVLVNADTAYRYLRYVGPNGGVGGAYCNIAEMTFYSDLLSAADAWRQLQFGSAANSGDAADDADPDGDGVINALERAYGGDPNVADAGMLPGIDPSAPVLSIVYRKATGASDLNFEVQECTNLVSGSWTAATGASEVLSDNGIIQSNCFTTPVGADSTKYLRVQVTSP